MTVDFYATCDADSMRPQWMPPCAYLLPATSFYRRDFPTPRLPAGAEVAVDWGGFVVQRRWRGELRFTVEQYVAWLRRVPGLTWAAIWDLPCEPELAGSPSAVRARQVWTRDRAAEFVEEYADEPWAWVPTIQGYAYADYKRACDDMAPIIEELAEWYWLVNRRAWQADLTEDGTRENPLLRADRRFRVGIGSLCARRNVTEIRTIVRYVADRFPGVPLHLWGVKLAALSSWHGMPASVVSTDSAAWNGRFGADLAYINVEMRRLRMSQRQYGYQVSLPRYLARFARAAGRPR